MPVFVPLGPHAIGSCKVLARHERLYLTLFCADHTARLQLSANVRVSISEREFSWGETASVRSGCKVLIA